MTTPATPSKIPVEVGLTAAIVAVEEAVPTVLVAPSRAGVDLAALPSGPFEPLRHRTFDGGLRDWVTEQTGVTLGYVEQLYTFGDRGRHAGIADSGPYAISVGYLALTRLSPGAATGSREEFQGWYDFLPWEDFRKGRPALLDHLVLPRLEAWAAAAPSRDARGLPPRERLSYLFAPGGGAVDEEKVLDRYELMYEAGLVLEAERDGREAPAAWRRKPELGRSMHADHRRILATAIGRLRGKLKYRPVIFELMPDAFTLTELQRTVEAISGRHLHKQNFRRLVEAAAVVEESGGMTTRTGGRPAALYRFRRDILNERPAPGLRVGTWA